MMVVTKFHYFFCQFGKDEASQQVQGNNPDTSQMLWAFEPDLPEGKCKVKSKSLFFPTYGQIFLFGPPVARSPQHHQSQARTG